MKKGHGYERDANRKRKDWERTHNAPDLDAMAAEYNRKHPDESIRNDRLAMLLRCLFRRRCLYVSRA